ncbi:Ionotropic receptor 225 [Frankliniella occidentalis]|nr:Ionotropic receptor 225 [Frankliniella occidentalis]
MQVLGLIGLLSTASCGLAPTVDLARRDGSNCIASYLSQLLTNSSAGIVIMGDDTYIAPILKQLPPGTPTSLLFDPGLVDDRLEYQFRTQDDIFLIAREVSADVLKFEFEPRVPIRARVLIWTHALSPEVDLTLARDKHLWYCPPQQVALAVSTFTGGTVLYHFQADALCDFNSSFVKAKEINRCTSNDQHWQNNNTVLRKACVDWKTSDKNSSIQILALRPDDETWNNFETWVMLIKRLIRRPVAVRQILVIDDEFARIYHSANYCRLATVVSSDITHGDVVMYGLMVLVPSGLGPQPGLLRAVTNEFSIELWIATVLSVLCVAAAMAVAMAAAESVAQHRWLVSLEDAFLEALAPLLSQPVGRATHRPLSTVWLLMCVVLAAAYQGLLLKQLTARMPEIANLQQLGDSGLSVIVQDELFQHADQVLTDKLMNRAKFENIYRFEWLLQELATKRNSAMIFYCDFYTAPKVSRWLALQRKTGPKRIHMFRLPGGRGRMSRSYPKGSPLQESGSFATQLMSASGLLQYHTLDRMQSDCGTASTLRPLCLREIQPAFLLLTFGYGISGLVFISEIWHYKVFVLRV